jgi:hypothetical protein
MRSKRGQGPFLKVASVMFTVGMLIFSVFMIIEPVMSNSYVTTDFAIDHLEYDVLSTRLVNAPECLAYDAGQVHTGLLDLDKFDSDRIDACLENVFEIKLSDDAGIVLKDISSDTEISSDAITSKFLVRYCKGECAVIQSGILEVSL